jgi:hypothetical protein
MKNLLKYLPWVIGGGVLLFLWKKWKNRTAVPRIAAKAPQATAALEEKTADQMRAEAATYYEQADRMDQYGHSEAATRTRAQADDLMQRAEAKDAMYRDPTII